MIWANAGNPHTTTTVQTRSANVMRLGRGMIAFQAHDYSNQRAIFCLHGHEVGYEQAGRRAGERSEKATT